MPEADTRLIVIGGSAGSLVPLRLIVAALPLRLPADVLISVHLSPTHISRLDTILARETRLPVRFAEDRQILTGGRILIAPPDHHLLVEDHAAVLNHGPKENLARPAIDPLFRTAAAAWGRRVIGVVLSGRLNDGTSGLLAIKQAGGIAVVQDPEDADQPSMPRSAASFVHVDHVAPAAQMGTLLVRLVDQPMGAALAPPDSLVLEAAIDRQPPVDIEAEDRLGERSLLTCPDCGGVLWKIDEEGLTRYRCHTGHAYTGEAMAEAQGARLEHALWSAVRLYRERVALARQMIHDALARGNSGMAEPWQRRAEEYDRDADAILSLLLHLDAGGAAGR